VETSSYDDGQVQRRWPEALHALFLLYAALRHGAEGVDASIAAATATATIITTITIAALGTASACPRCLPIEGGQSRDSGYENHPMSSYLACNQNRNWVVQWTRC
jgi:hypothetical protein